MNTDFLDIVEATDEESDTLSEQLESVLETQMNLLEQYIEEKTGRALNYSGKAHFYKLVKKYGLGEVLGAINSALEDYDHISTAFVLNQVEGVCISRCDTYTNYLKPDAADNSVMVWLQKCCIDTKYPCSTAEMEIVESWRASDNKPTSSDMYEHYKEWISKYKAMAEPVSLEDFQTEIKNIYGDCECQCKKVYSRFCLRESA